MTSHLIELLHRNTFAVSSVDEIPAETVNEAVHRDSFACIRGVFSREEILQARDRLRRNFSAARDHPARGEQPDSVMTNFQKVAIGGTMQSGVYRPRFIRTLYNPLWAEDIYGMHDVFRRMAALRNRLQGKPASFACDQIENGLWTAARIHHYPAGGGFLVAHRDTVLPKVTRERGHDQFHQLVLLLTRKGEDFTEGGGFVEIDGERLDFEAECELGDVMIYDGRTIHGVQDIDPGAMPDLSTLNGRLVAFVSLYKDMTAHRAA